MERPTCGTCPYFNNWGADIDLSDGECRRNAPKTIQTEEDKDLWVKFAIMYRHEWCGEHPEFPAYIKSLKEVAAESPASETLSAAVMT